MPGPSIIRKPSASTRRSHAGQRFLQCDPALLCPCRLRATAPPEAGRSPRLPGARTARGLPSKPPRIHAEFTHSHPRRATLARVAVRRRESRERATPRSRRSPAACRPGRSEGESSPPHRNTARVDLAETHLQQTRDQLVRQHPEFARLQGANPPSPKMLRSLARADPTPSLSSIANSTRRHPALRLRGARLKRSSCRSERRLCRASDALAQGVAGPVAEVQTGQRHHRHSDPGGEQAATHSTARCSAP